MADKIEEQVTEYGYRTPDGREVWANFSPSPMYGAGDITTSEGQEKTRKRFQQYLHNSGIPSEGLDLEFIQRVRTLSYSETIPLVPKPHEDEDEDEDLVGF